VQEQRLARAVLLVTALAFAGPGLGFLVAPDRLAGWLDLAPGSVTARSDLRAVMGGLELALAACLALCALRAARLRDGLALQMLAIGGLVAGRLVSLGADGTPGALAWLLLALEIVLLAFGVLAAMNLWAIGRRQSSTAEGGGQPPRALP
jgi:hypothetical protein